MSLRPLDRVIPPLLAILPLATLPLAIFAIGNSAIGNPANVVVIP
jgi:hypothetical protein